MTRRAVSLVALAAVVVGALVLGSRSGDSEPSPTARTRRLAAELRCPACENLSVADSPSPNARAIAEEIRRRVDAGESDTEIRQAFVDRYGEWILLEPTGSGFSALVWGLPAAALVLAGGGLVLAFRRWRRDTPPEPTEADRALVERARATRGEAQ